jgi:ankyrin repeat protein
VRVLLTAHANAGAANDVGDTPLHMVARQGLRSAEDVIKMLLDESADPAAVNNVSDTMGKPRCCIGSPPQNAPSLFGSRVGI